MKKMVLGVSNPFRSKWKHKSTTIEIKDETSDPKRNKKKSTVVPFNSDSLLNGVGDYVFHSPLGDGKFSKVMLAQHYCSGERVAIKMINKRAHEYRVMSRLVREVYLMEVLEHENIVRLKETIETADALYLVMEYVKGLNLEEYLKTLEKGRLDENEARLIFRQLVKAVDHCHSKWVVHRDLKAPNVLLTPDNQVKLADFGLGNRFGLHRLNTICGSMLYYSPEIISARSYVGPEVDCWCLGIILFRMTAGYEPFSHAKTVSELKKYVLGRHYKIPSHLSPDLQKTIQKCLSVEKYDRLCLRSCLDGDRWLNDSGACEDVFRQKPSPLYHAIEVTEDYAISGRSEDKAKMQLSSKNTKVACKRDLENEKKRGNKVPKTIIYHITNPSTYFTGPAPHSSKQPIDLDAQSAVRAGLDRHISESIQLIKLHPVHQLTELKSPISHLFRKFKRPESLDEPCNPKLLRKTSSNLSLTQIYQRVAKDHISYYTLQCKVRTYSATTVLSSSSASSTVTAVDRQAQTKEGEKSQEEMIKLLRHVCALLGITYYQSAAHQLECLLTLRNFKSPVQYSAAPHSSSLFRSKLFSSNDRLSEMHRQQKTTTSSFASVHSTNPSTLTHQSPGWWTRQAHRLSHPSSTGLSKKSSSHDLLSMGRFTQELQLKQQSNEEDNDGYVLLTVDVLSIQAHDEGQVVAVRYAKVKGSSKVFKLAKGWIQMVLKSPMKPLTGKANYDDPITTYTKPVH
ncbi:kinase-like domain-containing protein [Sporodiniella umbellata]|nr:kinase-like domain-containing protein [Sporodiniella umbellata]